MIRQSVLKETYTMLEEARMTLWLEIVQHEALEGPLEPDKGPLIDQTVQVEKENDRVKITIKDILPRTQDMIKKTIMRNYWYTLMNHVLQKVNVHYDAIILTLKIFYPTRNSWDVDNRPVKFIIDSLRYNRVIADDSWDKLGLQILGGYDPDNPRTEIIIEPMPCF
ncbi:MAG: hypothetical protein HPY90_12080 [Syntrophothermus sp.]|uniref:hypothetical protein n=1 Tax=Syntrophothermus sp. TaxID=2736299 RepID=UPI00257A97E1|nr:hypothetical protein [Syntrophothermus sp.]NSW83987.1 hypothetical protein [Syntrophothermus sp.]